MTRQCVLAFATHGLIAGEVEGLAEPALMLTPPVEPYVVDDGFPNASEIAALRLRADGVLLMACNSAAPDGQPDATVFSGLARAFLYAGARSFTVSHWQVDSAAGLYLTVEERAAIAAQVMEHPGGAPHQLTVRWTRVAYQHPVTEVHRLVAAEAAPVLGRWPELGQTQGGRVLLAGKVADISCGRPPRAKRWQSLRCGAWRWSPPERRARSVGPPPPRRQAGTRDARVGGTGRNRPRAGKVVPQAGRADDPAWTGCTPAREAGALESVLP